MRESTLKTDNIQQREEDASPAQIIEKIENECRNCTVLTPLTCATKCETWRIKKEFRKLYKIMNNSNYMINLLNALKNKRRIQILEILSKQKISLARIRQELKFKGYNHSQKTIEQEYITPLVNVGLVEQQNGKYYATIFGSEINELIKNFEEISQIFPAHSECYEETIISILRRPKTYEELKQFIPSKSVARVLQRLSAAKLIQKPEERDYVYYFRTKRDPTKLKLSPTEEKVYGNIPSEGIPAGKLADRTGISLRRTYKYLKRLRRKKLVFTRKKPKTYALTSEGFRIAIGLSKIRKLVAGFLAATALLVKDEKLLEKLMPDTKKGKRKRKETEAIPLLVIL